MAARSIASLSLSFGLVSIPIKLYSATENSAAIRFRLMTPSGARVRQQYVSDILPRAIEEERARKEPEPTQEPPIQSSRGSLSKVVEFPSSRQAAAPPYEPPAAESVVERTAMLKGYEYEKGKFVLFTPEELKTFEAGSRKTIDIVSFVPENKIDPIYFDKAYFLAPDKGGSKPYNLLLRAMRDTGRCALARWAFRSKGYVAQLRAAEGGLVLQQLLYAEEVRSFADLKIKLVEVADAELELAKQLIEQISADSFDPTEFVDEEKKRILAAVEAKIAGKQISPLEKAPTSGSQVVSLLDSLRASLQAKEGAAGEGAAGGTAKGPTLSPRERKPAKRASSRPTGLKRGRSANSGK